MGGAGVIRTAAKLAGIGAAATSSSGIRGVAVTPPAEQSVRNASRPVSAVVSSSQKVKVAEVAPLHTAASWDGDDDWEVADGGELIMEAGEAVPRVVFGGVPTFQEAKSATVELKDAIEKIYMSSNPSECEGSSPGSQESVVSPFHSELETQSRVIQAISNPSSVPNHALRAFQLLSTSAEAQTVVANIACDPNVWNAVLQNPALQDFFQSQQTVAGFEEEGTPEKVKELPDSDSGNSFVDFMGILNNLKLTVAEMVSGVSNYLQNIFGFVTAEKSFGGADASGNTKTNFMDHMAVGGTLMGLAVLVVMVVVLKRA